MGVISRSLDTAIARINSNLTQYMRKNVLDHHNRLKTLLRVFVLSDYMWGRTPFAHTGQCSCVVTHNTRRAPTKLFN